jgi:hypothetical protein
MSAKPAKPRTAVFWWAIVGIAALAVQTSVWIPYLASGPETLTQFRDPSSNSYIWARILETVNVIALVGTLAFVIRDVRSNRAWTRNAMWLTAFASMIWLDPLLNYFRPGFYFSSNLVNLESWISYLPGQMAPYANLIPFPAVWVPATYVGSFLPICLMLVGVMEYLSRRYPNALRVVPVAGAAVFAMFFDLLIELPMLRTEVFAYPAASHAWSIWGGQTYQFPLIELAAAVLFWMTCATLMRQTRHFELNAIEGGLDRVTGRRTRTLIQQLAYIGLANLIFLCTSMGMTQISVWYTDDFPSGYNQDLHNGWCGDAGQPYGVCPGPGVSWHVRGPDDMPLHASEILAP